MIERVIISLTSYPARIEYVYKTIESLMKQSVQAEKILLYLSDCEFKAKGIKLPERLAALIGINGFEVRWVHNNLKPHKKYFYALQEYRDRIVITVDDDFYYDKGMVGDLLTSYRKYPNAISARNVHLMLKEEGKIVNYQKWENSTVFCQGKGRMDLCAVGCGGILYPPFCASSGWFDQKKMAYFQNQDDLWLKYNEIIDGIPVVMAQTEGCDVIIEAAQEGALYKHNVFMGNDRCIAEMMAWLQRDDTDIWSQLIENLEDIDEFQKRRKSFYQDYFQSLFRDSFSKDVYICGAGQYADVLYRFLEGCDLDGRIKAFLVQREQKNTCYHHKPIWYINKLHRNDEFYAICGVSKKFEKELWHALEQYSLCHWISVDIDELRSVQRYEESLSG